MPPARGSFFLFGPRGTGKSAWIRHHMADALLIDLLDPAAHRTFSTRPERLLQLADACSDPATIVIDELQKAPQLLDVVHALIERRSALRFVLTGSSARKLKHVGVDLLAGRAVVRTMHPFTASELGADWSTPTALATGLVPLVHRAADPADTLRAYVALYLHQEVQHEGLVRDIGAFGRFLEAMAFSHGAPLNLAAVSRDCEVPRKTVDGFLAILEDLLVGFRIPVFARAARRELSQHHKFFYFDTGVFRALRPKGALDRPGDIAGPALEGLVAQHLRAWLAYAGSDAVLHHWRTVGGTEVDFVVYGSSVFAAVEVKSADRVRQEDFSGLAAFGRDYPMARRFLVYRGGETFVERGVRVVPLERFLCGGLAELDESVGGDS